MARRVGELFHSMGLLPFPDVVEVSASDLQTGYIGQAGKETLKVLRSAKGKVLFIDEVSGSVPMLSQVLHPVPRAISDH